MSEPTELRAGDTWTWTREAGEYPAATWTLTYKLRSSRASIDITASTSGLQFAVAVAASVTAAYKADRYDWIARVTSGTTVHTVGSGVIAVLPNLGAVGAVDARSHARRVLDAIEAVIEKRATLDQSSYSIGNRSLARLSIPELLQFRDRYRAMVLAEERAARIASGGVGGTVMVRF
jgi:hypothetical protein